jgi:hypothetical protein
MIQQKSIVYNVKLKTKTKTVLTAPIGNIITHKSPGGTKTRKRTGLFGIFNMIQEAYFAPIGTCISRM